MTGLLRKEREQKNLKKDELLAEFGNALETFGNLRLGEIKALCLQGKLFLEEHREISGKQWSVDYENDRLSILNIAVKELQRLIDYERYLRRDGQPEEIEGMKIDKAKIVKKVKVVLSELYYFVKGSTFEAKDTSFLKGSSSSKSKKTSLLVASTISSESEWTKGAKLKTKIDSIDSKDQYYQTLIKFCRTYLNIEEVQKQFQSEIRDFLNREVPELAENPIRNDTRVTFCILGSDFGKSTSTYFDWIQDGKHHTKTIGLARYLNRTGITDIPR